MLKCFRKALSVSIGETLSDLAALAIDPEAGILYAVDNYCGCIRKISCITGHSLGRINYLRTTSHFRSTSIEPILIVSLEISIPAQKLFLLVHTCLSYLVVDLATEEVYERSTSKRSIYCEPQPRLTKQGLIAHYYVINPITKAHFQWDPRLLQVTQYKADHPKFHGELFLKPAPVEDITYIKPRRLCFDQHGRLFVMTIYPEHFAHVRAYSSEGIIVGSVHIHGTRKTGGMTYDCARGVLIVSSGNDIIFVQPNSWLEGTYNWSPVTHTYAPKPHRKIIKTLFLLRNIVLESCFSLLPNELMFLIADLICGRKCLD